MACNGWESSEIIRIPCAESALAPRGLCLLAIAACLVSGCSKSPHEIENQKPVHPVSGKVLVKGQPAAGAFVLFVPVNEPAENPDPRPRATAGEDGSFAVSTYGDADGASSGQYVVAISWEDPESRSDRFGGRFDATKSKLRADVKEGKNELTPFQLR